MVNKVVFFNYYHNGDIHVSRSLVDEASKLCIARGVSCEYFNRNDPSLIADLKYVKHTNNPYCTNQAFKSIVTGDTLFINTWYCGDPEIYAEYGLEFDTLYASFKKALKLIDINLDEVIITDLFPGINFECFDISHARDWLLSHSRKRVFISNGNVLSGQSLNFPFAEIINKISDRYKNIDFLISNSEPGIIGCQNVFMTSNIIKKNGCDLNENSYLASNCDLIIGRMSGTYTFSMTRENYFEKPKKFLVFSSLSENVCRWTVRFTPPIKAEIIRVETDQQDNIINAIEQNLPTNPQS